MKKAPSSRDRYVPSPIGEAEVQKDGDRFTLIFVRQLKQPPQKIWLALTDPDHLKEWAPFDADSDLGSTGSAQLTMEALTPPRVYTAEIRVAEAPRVLEFNARYAELFGVENTGWPEEVVGS